MKLEHCPNCHTKIDRDTKTQPINTKVKGYDTLGKEVVCRVCGTSFKR